MYGGGSFVAMPSTMGAYGGGYGGYGGYAATPTYGGYGGYAATPAYGGAYGAYGGYGGMTAGSSYGANPLLDHMPMGYLGVGTTESKPKASGAETKKRGVKMAKKKAKGCC